MSPIWIGISGGIAAVIGLAMLAVFLSKNSNTPKVIESSATGLSDVIKAAVSPITAGTGGSGAESVTSSLGLSNSTGNLLYG